MFDIDKELSDLGLTRERYKSLLEECQNKTHRLTDKDWSEIAAEYGLSYSADAIRKASQLPILGGSFVKQFYDEEGVYDDNNDYFKNKLRELEQAKIQYRDERNAWQKQNYLEARLTTTLDRLEESLHEISPVYFSLPNKQISSLESEQELIVCLSDMHIGLTFQNSFGSYSVDIAQQRLNKYLEKVINTITFHNVKKVVIVSLGDQISGSIHKTTQVANKENVIEQVKIASELIASFCSQISKHVDEIRFVSVAGNHTRLDKKNESIHDERLDDLIAWIVINILSSDEKFKSIPTIDSGIAFFESFGKTFVCVHGDFDPMNNASVNSLSSFLHYFPDVILKGHMHSPAYSVVNGIKVIQSGTLAGCGDDYTLEKRLRGCPSQTMLLLNQGSIESIINVDL